MSYRCGTRGLSVMGIPDGEARIECDGCGLVKLVTKASGMPFEWFMSNKSVPGWSLKKHDDNCQRIDKCPRCKRIIGKVA